MIKAKLTGENGKQILLLALSHANLDRLRSDGLNGFIQVRGEEVGLPVDVYITAGETEAALTHDLQRFIGPDTVVHTSEKLKQ